MYKKYLDDIKYCIKNFDVDESNYNVFTPSELGIDGDDSNKIYLKSDSIPEFLVISIDKNAKNSKIFLGKNLIKKLKSYIYIKQSNEFFYMGDNCGVADVRFMLYGEDRFVIIGEGVEMIQHGSKWILGTNAGDGNNSIIVGDHCMIAGENIIRATDGHPVIDLITNKEVNMARSPVIIEPYCWLGQRVSLLKNVRVGACSIVAMGTIMSRSCEKFSSVYGVPNTNKNIYGKLWRKNNSKQSIEIFEIYKKRFVLGEKNDNNQNTF